MADIALNGKANVNGEWLCNQRALQGYTIFCCQSSDGGMKDKPRKNVDIYHTMYSLAGMSICQHKSKIWEKQMKEEAKGEDSDKVENTCLLAGAEFNLLERVNPLYNARDELIQKAKNYFRNGDEE